MMANPATAMTIEFGSVASGLLEGELGKATDLRLEAIRETLAAQIGLVIPPIHRDINSQLPNRAFTISFFGEEVQRGALRINSFAALGTLGRLEKLKGQSLRLGPLSGKWIEFQARPVAEKLGVLVFTCLDFLTTITIRTVRFHSSKLFTLAQFQSRWELFQIQFPVLASHVLEKVDSTECYQFLIELLKTGHPIRDLRRIAEIILDADSFEKGLDRCRSALTSTRLQQFCDANKVVKTITLPLDWNGSSVDLNNGLENAFARSTKKGNPPILIYEGEPKVWPDAIREFAFQRHIPVLHLSNCPNDFFYKSSAEGVHDSLRQPRTAVAEKLFFLGDMVRILEDLLHQPALFCAYNHDNLRELINSLSGMSRWPEVKPTVIDFYQERGREIWTLSSPGGSSSSIVKDHYLHSIPLHFLQPATFTIGVAGGCAPSDRTLGTLLDVWAEVQDEYTKWSGVNPPAPVFTVAPTAESGTPHFYAYGTEFGRASVDNTNELSRLFKSMILESAQFSLDATQTILEQLRELCPRPAQWLAEEVPLVLFRDVLNTLLARRVPLIHLETIAEVLVLAEPNLTAMVTSVELAIRGR